MKLSIRKENAMGKLDPNQIYVNLGEVVSLYTYKDFIYFMYNLGMDYYDGLNIISKEEWQAILEALKENYQQYEVEKTINYRQFRANMADFLSKKFRKHPSLFQVMQDALTSFEKGNKNAKLKYLIRDFEEHEALEKEFLTLQW